MARDFVGWVFVGDIVGSPSRGLPHPFFGSWPTIELCKQLQFAKLSENVGLVLHWMLVVCSDQGLIMKFYDLRLQWLRKIPLNRQDQ